MFTYTIAVPTHTLSYKGRYYIVTLDGSWIIIPCPLTYPHLRQESLPLCHCFIVSNKLPNLGVPSMFQIILFLHFAIVSSKLSYEL